MGLIEKKPDWTIEKFRQYWTEVHGPIAAKLPGLRRYHQNHVVDTTQRGITYKRGPEHVDGFSELQFDSLEAMHEAFRSDVAPSLAEDENRFLGKLRIIAVDQRTVIEPAADKKLLKRMSFLRRRKDVDPETFEREWRIEHARLVKLMPNVFGYRQNLVLERQVNKGTPSSYDEMPIDGVVELWFTDTEALNAAFASPEGQRTMAHAGTFIDEITTFLVETRKIIG